MTTKVKCFYCGNNGHFDKEEEIEICARCYNTYLSYPVTSYQKRKQDRINKIIVREAKED